MAARPGDELCLAYVLHRRDYGNTSLLVELFTRAGGRFPVLAKGAKGPRAPGAALLQPFRSLLVRFAGRGEVKTLCQVEASETPPALQGQALYCGFYLNELLMRLLARGDAHEGLFDQYGTTLGALPGEADLGGLLRRFELCLLAETGYALVLDREAATGAALCPDTRYHYDPERGPLAAQDGGQGGLVSGRTLLALAQRARLDPAAGREARDLLRRVLAHHLGGKPLRSRELFSQR